MNVLVTGANGQLGNCIRCASKGSANNYIFTDIKATEVDGTKVLPLDITDASAVTKLVYKHKIDVLINCAAYTNVDRAESDEVLAELLNATAVGNLAQAIKSVNETLIHISTDYVYGGANGNTPRTEQEPPRPTGVYGKTKLHGEQIIADCGVKALIFRTAWLYSEYGNNFVKTILRLISTRDELKVVFDQCGTPTYAQDLADAIIHIISHNLISANEGIYHYSNEGVCSWFDFAKVIAEISNNKCSIKPCHSKEFPSAVVRPAYSVLDKTKFKQTFGIDIPYWTDSLRECIGNIKSNDLAS